MMKIEYYPDENKVKQAMQGDEPLLVLVSYNGKHIIISSIDDSFEHVILLRQLGYKDTDIDSYFRLVVNKSGADWTFACPAEYKKIKIKDKRIEKFYNDGFMIIPSALKRLGYDVKLVIPKRYQRHLKTK
ncbi:hypothetical protein ACFL57_04795 [Candidatus Margulisiibacteriota bacterium]